MPIPSKTPYRLHCPKCGWREIPSYSDHKISQGKPIFQGESYIIGFACPKCDTPLKSKKDSLLDKIKSLF